MYSSGGKYLIIVPSGLRKNLAKFQGTTFDFLVYGSYSSLFFLRYAYKGCGF